ncbi:group protein, partial [Moniliophthora roreri]
RYVCKTSNTSVENRVSKDVDGKGCVGKSWADSSGSGGVWWRIWVGWGVCAKSSDPR